MIDVQALREQVAAAIERARTRYTTMDRIAEAAGFKRPPPPPSKPGGLTFPVVTDSTMPEGLVLIGAFGLGARTWEDPDSPLTDWFTENPPVEVQHEEVWTLAVPRPSGFVDLDPDILDGRSPEERQQAELDRLQREQEDHHAAREALWEAMRDAGAPEDALGAVWSALTSLTEPRIDRGYGHLEGPLLVQGYAGYGEFRNPDAPPVEAHYTIRLGWAPGWRKGKGPHDRDA